jgi:hypothetical protein
MRQLSHGPIYQEIAGLVWKAREARWSATTDGHSPVVLTVKQMLGQNQEPIRSLSKDGGGFLRYRFLFVECQEAGSGRIITLRQRQYLAESFVKAQRVFNWHCIPIA